MFKKKKKGQSIGWAIKVFYYLVRHVIFAPNGVPTPCPGLPAKAQPSSRG